MTLSTHRRQIKILTIPFDHQRHSFETSEFDALQREQTIVSSQPIFFVSPTGPSLTLILTLSESSEARASNNSNSNSKPNRENATKPQPSQFSERVAKTTQKTSDLLAELPTADRELFRRLQTWRKSQAQADGVPPYVVFTNRELLGLVLNRPNTESAMQKIAGIGKKKAQRHGRSVLELLHADATPTALKEEAHNDD